MTNIEVLNKTLIPFETLLNSEKVQKIIYPELFLIRVAMETKIFTTSENDRLAVALNIFEERFMKEGQFSQSSSWKTSLADTELMYVYYFTKVCVYGNLISTHQTLFNSTIQLILSLSSTIPSQYHSLKDDVLDQQATVNSSKVSTVVALDAKVDTIKARWEKIKCQCGFKGSSPSEAVDILLQMIGLASIKDEFITLYNDLSLSREQKMTFDSFNLNTRFVGNPGTGKTTVAKLFSSFLTDVGILPDSAIIIIKTGSELCSMGVAGFQKELDKVKTAGGGVVFVDEAYQLDDANQGHKILDFILGQSEKLKGDYGKIVWIIAGYKKQIDDLLKHNPGLPSRFPKVFNFEDYSNDELQDIFEGLMKRGGRDLPAPNLNKVKQEEKQPKSASSSLLMKSNNRYRPSYSTPYSMNQIYNNQYDDAEDKWGNTWTWDQANYTWVDGYDNISGKGVHGLGTASNPLVSRKDNVMWLFDEMKKDWYHRDDPSKRSSVYPGKPLPPPKEPPIHPFIVINKKWLRIAIGRLGKLRGTNGFGNARAVRNLFQIVRNRQVKRISRQRDNGLNPNIFCFEKEDLLGPKASMEVLQKSSAYIKLLKMEGLHSVKNSIRSLLELVIENADREEQEKPMLEVALNRIFLGNPGTGKTTVAGLYAQILTDIGMLSKGEVIFKTASDFVGGALGKSEEITRGILEQAQGNVLVIDEAYGLFQETGSNTNEPYREAVINTLVEQIQGKPGEDRAVVMLGYREEMENMLSKCNPGLSRRFQLDEAFIFEDYDDAALERILIKVIKEKNLKISVSDSRFAISQLGKARSSAHFGNAGAVNNLLSSAILRFQRRIRMKRQLGEFVDPDLLMDDDFKGEDYVEEAISPEDLLSTFVGATNIREKLEKVYATVDMCKKRNKDPKDVATFTWVFTGAPGTGKTTIARLMGKMFRSLGLIPSDEVIECSASDLIAAYVGQTGSKTREMFLKARGKVLFIDEAYQLNSNKNGSSYSQEAVDEIVKLLTSLEYKGKLIVILAGYQRDIDLMLEVNQGLRSRFTERVHFENLTVDVVNQLLVDRLKEFGIKENVPETTLKDYAQELVNLPGFANGRDVDTFVKKIEAEMLVRSYKTNCDNDTIIPEDLQKAITEMKQLKAPIDLDLERSEYKDRLQLKQEQQVLPNLPPPQFNYTMNRETIQNTQLDCQLQEDDAEMDISDSQEVEAEVSQEDDQDNSKKFGKALQDLLDNRGLNTRVGVRRLARLNMDSIEMNDLAEEIAKVLNCDYITAVNLLKQWQESQLNVEEQVEQQLQEVEKARKEGRKALVPIWRCGVCGRADEPYIACYVQPFIVRYEERLLKKA
jgi:SpoVK/Ycf46/Vps4 family AAA+-type ATPase